MSAKPIRESRPSVHAAQVILVCGLAAVVGFGRIAWTENGDLFMKLVTIALAVGTPVLAFMAGKKARKAGDDDGSANV